MRGLEWVLTARRVVSLKIIRVRSKSNKSIVNSIIYLVGFVYRECGLGGVIWAVLMGLGDLV